LRWRGLSFAWKAMSLTARLRTMAWICCCLLASWGAQAQESAKRSGDFLAGPGDLGISAKGGTSRLLSGPAIGSISLPADRSLNFPHEFTLGSAQSSVTLGNSSVTPGNTGNGGVFGGEKPSADKSCLAVRAYMRPDIANKNLHQNWISANNTCSRGIKIRICYLGSANCISVNVSPWQTKSAIIGYAPTSTPIHYQISLEN
jgi:hypothetical protein